MKRVLAFLHDRLGLPDLTALATRRMPAGSSLARSLGWLLLMLLLSQVITGVAMSFHYTPSPDHAYDSIRHMERDQPFGSWLRSLHSHGASFLVVLLVIHAMRCFFAGAYKKPRELVWISGLLMLGIVAGLGFTGYLLPWDQRAYHASKVGVSIAGSAPVVGESIRELLYGGPEMGPNTLGRFHALHVLLLPLLLTFLLALHLWLFSLQGPTPSRGPGEDIKGPSLVQHLAKVVAVLILAMAALVIYSALVPAPLEAEALSGETQYDPRPEWYFLGLFELLHWFPTKLESLGSFWLPNLFLVLLLLLPFLDRNPERRLRKRPIALAAGTLFAIATISLTLMGAARTQNHYLVPKHPLDAEPEILRGYRTLRREECLSCHTLTLSKTESYGTMEEDAPDFMDPLDQVEGFESDPSLMVDFLADPESEVMPKYDHLSESDRRALALYLTLLRQAR